MFQHCVQVGIPYSNLYNIVTVRCGHCANLLSVNIGHLQHEISLPFHDFQVKPSSSSSPTVLFLLHFYVPSSPPLFAPSLSYPLLRVLDLIHGLFLHAIYNVVMIFFFLFSFMHANITIYNQLGLEYLIN